MRQSITPISSRWRRSLWTTRGCSSSRRWRGKPNWFRKYWATTESV